MKCVCRLFVGLILVFGNLDAGQVFLNDGDHHLVDDDRYDGDDVFLDDGVSVYPGTHLELESPGVIGGFVVGYNNSRITITSGGLSGVSAKGNCKAVINDGIVALAAHVDDSAELRINGGTIGGMSGEGVEAWNNGYADIHGGSLHGLLRTWGDGFIELHGAFSVDGNVLSNYESLRNYGTLVATADGEWQTGIVTGRLADGTIIESEYFIMVFNYWGPTSNGDIVVYIEPLISSVVPDGGEVFVAGDQAEIKWYCKAGIETVKLEYSADFGQTWFDIASVPASDMSYFWTIPQINSQFCLIRISDFEVPFISSVSGDSFTIYICPLDSDLTGDCKVNMQDLAVFVSEWLIDANPFQ